MKAGTLRHRLRVTRDDGTTDATTGVHTPSDTTVYTRWAWVGPSADGRFASMRAMYPGAGMGAEVRYDSTSITTAAGWTATWLNTDRVFEILGSLDPDGTRERVHVALLDRGVARGTVTP